MVSLGAINKTVTNDKKQHHRINLVIRRYLTFDFDLFIFPREIFSLKIGRGENYFNLVLKNFSNKFIGHPIWASSIHEW